MSMFDNFDNVSESYIPCNLFKGFDKADNIVWGGTTVHEFLLSGNYIGQTKRVSVIYKQYTYSHRLIKEENEIRYDEGLDKTVVTCTLSPRDTMSFDKHYNVAAQVKLELVNGEVIYTRLLEIKMIETLEGIDDVGPEPVPPGPLPPFPPIPPEPILIFDTEPTLGSTNPVTSDGIKRADDAITARAIAAENEIIDMIMREQARAEESERNLSDLISKESSDREHAEDIINASLNTHRANKDNPHEVTAAQVGLGNVDNTSDLDKPLSTATQTALDDKVDKVSGKGLSANDFTNAYKDQVDANATKLDTIASGAQVNVIEGITVNSTEVAPSNKVVNIDLTSYAEISDMETYAKSLTVSIDGTTFVMTFTLKDANDNTLNTQTIDLPLEAMVVSGSYDDTTKSLILTLKSGQTITIPVSDLISGLVSESSLATTLLNYYTNTQVDTLLSNKADKEGPLPKVTISNPNTKLYEFATTHSELLNKKICLEAWAGNRWFRAIGSIDYSSGPHLSPYVFSFTSDVDYYKLNIYGLDGDENYTIDDLIRTKVSMECQSNRVNSISSSSTNGEYPTAKAVYDLVDSLPELSYESTLDILTSVIMPEGTSVSNNNATFPEGVTVSLYSHNLKL